MFALFLLVLSLEIATKMNYAIFKTPRVFFEKGMAAVTFMISDSECVLLASSGACPSVSCMAAEIVTCPVCTVLTLIMCVPHH